jgi:endonuclease/exonuclease/phosphatase family metal-dependent hydrolase
MSKVSLLRLSMGVWLCSLCSCSSGPEQTPTSVRIATFNAHDLFDDQKDGDEMVVDRATYTSHVRAVAQVLFLLNSDIVVLQEIETLRILERLAAVEAAGLGYGHAVLVPGNDPRGINIGVLSRLPFDAVVSHKNDVFPGAEGTHRYARDCLELHRTVGDRDLVLLAVHLKSKAVPDDPDKRLAEARHTRTIADSIVAADPSAAVLILGDMNDVPGSAPLLAIEGTESGPYTDAAYVLPNAWTYDYGGARQLIDHQMMNPQARPMLDPGSVAIPHGTTVERASDHAPLAATYVLR